jgi:pyruvate dehydrogenase E2 component (dihydrolipoamide acetyltransferase)
MSKKDIKVPNIGEFKDVEVIEVLIQKGQQIKKNEPLITIESDKSSVEIPSPDSGTITSLDVKVGDKVSEGDKILEIEIAKDVVEKNKIELYGQKKTEEIIEVKTPENKSKTNPQNLIVRDFSSITSASPKVRKFARELGVDISKVAGSERQGRITESDIKFFVATKSNENHKNINEIKQEYSHSEFGKIEIKDIPRIKRLSSKYLMTSWTNIPHVTNHDEADITELEEFRKSLTDMYSGEKKKNKSISFYRESFNSIA